MAREKKHSEERTLQLVHPVYLDVPMLVSFVAAAEDGFALESEQTEKGATATDRSREAGGRARARVPGPRRLGWSRYVGTLPARRAGGGKQGNEGHTTAH